MNYCWRTPGAENYASHMPLLKGQKPGESNTAIEAVSRGKRLANSIRRLNEKLGRCRVQGCNPEKNLSFCRLTEQPLINELADGVDERHCRHDGSSSDYRPKFRVFTEKA